MVRGKLEGLTFKIRIFLYTSKQVKAPPEWFTQLWCSNERPPKSRWFTRTSISLLAILRGSGSGSGATSDCLWLLLPRHRWKEQLHPAWLLRGKGKESCLKGVAPLKDFVVQMWSVPASPHIPLSKAHHMAKSKLISREGHSFNRSPCILQGKGWMFQPPIKKRMRESLKMITQSWGREDREREREWVGG